MRRMQLVASARDCEVARMPHTAHRRGSQIMRIRRNGGEFEGLGLLRTFVGDPATAQWATVGEAPAPQLSDRSRSRPQRGNGRERLPPPSRT